MYWHSNYYALYTGEQSMRYGVIYSWTFWCLTYKNKTYKMSRNLTNICTLEACQSIRSAAEKKGESFMLHILNSIYGDLIVAEGKYHGNMELNGELPQSSEKHCVASFIKQKIRKRTSITTKPFNAQDPGPRCQYRDCQTSQSRLPAFANRAANHSG